MDVLFKLPFSSLFSLCVAGYAVEHIAYHTTKLVTCAAAFFASASAGGFLAGMGGVSVTSPWASLPVVLLSATLPWASPAVVSIFGCDPEYIVFPIVYDDTRVKSNARVRSNARVKSDARVKNDARVKSVAMVKATQG